MLSFFSGLDRAEVKEYMLSLRTVQEVTEGVVYSRTKKVKKSHIL